MMIILGFIFALARAAHGGGHVGRLLSIFIMALGFTLVHISTWGLIDAALYGVGVWALLVFGLVFGWGKGFAAITGRYFIDEKDFLPADLMGDLVFVKSGNAKLAGVVFFTVRSIAFLPLFIILAKATGDYGYLLSGLSVLSMGAVYYLAGRVIEESKSVRLAEVLYFFIIGAALA